MGQGPACAPVRLPRGIRAAWSSGSARCPGPRSAAGCQGPQPLQGAGGPGGPCRVRAQAQITVWEKGLSRRVPRGPPQAGWQWGGGPRSSALPLSAVPARHASTAWPLVGGRGRPPICVRAPGSRRLSLAHSTARQGSRQAGTRGGSLFRGWLVRPACASWGPCICGRPALGARGLQLPSGCRPGGLCLCDFVGSRSSRVRAFAASAGLSPVSSIWGVPLRARPQLASGARPACAS